MDSTDTEIIDLIDRGFMLWDEIAEELNTSPAYVRRKVQRLCARHDCQMAELPERVAAAA